MRKARILVLKQLPSHFCELALPSSKYSLRHRFSRPVESGVDEMIKAECDAHQNGGNTAYPIVDDIAEHRHTQAGEQKRPAEKRERARSEQRGREKHESVKGDPHD